MDTNKIISEKALEDVSRIPMNWEQSDSDENSFVVEYITLSIKQISRYSAFVDPEILHNFTQTLEKILRIKEMSDLIISDEEQREVFGDAIGNLMD